MQSMLDFTLILQILAQLRESESIIKHFSIMVQEQDDEIAD